MPKAIDIRKGQLVEWEGQLWIVHSSDHVAKGNKRSYMQIRMKNFKSGNTTDNRFRVDEDLPTPHVDDRVCEFLYREGEDFVVMDTENFEQYHVKKDLCPDGESYLKGNEKLNCKFIEGQIAGVDLPYTVELQVTDAPPVVKGATVTNQSKEVTLETGFKVRVPPFISTGEVIRVDTRTGQYLERA